MTPPSDYLVRGPEDVGEVRGLRPVGQQDGRGAPRRDAPPRRRRREPAPDPAADRTDPPEPDETHEVDTLA